MENEIKFRDYPILGWLFGFSSIGLGIYFYLTQQSSIPVSGLFAIGLGVLFLLFGYGLTITANKQTRTLKLDYRSIPLHSIKEIQFDAIKTIRLDSQTTRNRNSGMNSRSITYCILAEMKDGTVIPFRSFYSGGFFRKQKIVDDLRQFMDLPEAIDESPIGLFRAAPKIGAVIAQAQQQAISGSNAQEHVTDGVHWFLQSAGMGASPITRWFSPDFKTNDGFLFLAQKVAGQQAGGLLASFGSLLFQQSISLYGFSANDTPNISQGEILASLPPLVDAHFSAFSSNRTEALQILNPWTQNPLGEWGQSHPMKAFQSAGAFTQLIVLFSPNGVYLGTMGTLQTAEVEELTNLGVELVKAQGAS